MFELEFDEIKMESGKTMKKIHKLAEKCENNDALTMYFANILKPICPSYDAQRD